jgi:tetratricopeptide (TPR) repeat protein
LQLINGCLLKYSAKKTVYLFAITFSWMHFLKRLFLLPALLLAFSVLKAQPKLSFQMKKPKEFENRQLPSEKYADKKFTGLRHFFQNNYTHYNYFFNANLRLNEIIEESKLRNADNYTKLLPFFPYSLDETSRSTEIDSILQKCTAGILLHDLRNDWIDNLYLVMGKAYLLRKNFDSAAMTFQFINYSYAPKEKGGYDRPMGSNTDETGNAFTISTKEKTKKLSYLVTRPPSRNEAFVWQVRTLTESGNYLDASSLIDVLKNDPYFPARLKEEMAEARAYLYYKIEMWDSSATYLVKAIPSAENQQEKARAWYLAGQMFQKAGNTKRASEAYAKCTSLALDPVMEVYARLNSIRLNKSDDPNIIDANVASLVSMAKKDKYQSYRDIIYYAAALFEMERNGYDAAVNFLEKSIRFNTIDPPQRSRSFMELGDISFQVKKYDDAGLYYDSVVDDHMDDSAFYRLQKRRPGTHIIYFASQVIKLQDSLLMLSAKDEAERTAIVKQVSKRLRKERGLKDDPNLSGSSEATPMRNPAASNNVSTAASLFSQGDGTWYFSDPTVRGNGFNKFRQKWGARPNVDNWRRISAIPINQPVKSISTDTTQNLIIPTDSITSENFDTSDISFDNLYSRIPLSEERRAKTYARLSKAYFVKGTALHEQIEDYPEAIKAFEKSLSIIDTGMNAEQSLFALVHCYTETGDQENANRCRQLLQKNFAGSPGSIKLDKKEQANQAIRIKEEDVTYKKIYDLFIEGSFDQAMAAKKQADSSLGTYYWTPQLLYIESVYHIRQKEDSLAILSLNNIKKEFPTHPLAERAGIMIDVLGRRKEIEEYLTKLEITRAKEDETVISLPKPRQQQLAPPDSLKKTDLKATTITPIKDTTSKLVTGVVTQPSPYTINPSEPVMVAMLLEKVDPAYVNEVLYAFTNSGRKNFHGQMVEASKKKLKENLWLVMLRSAEFKNAETAVDYISYIKPIAQKELISWLDASKYSYIILSEQNYDLLQQDPNMPLYLKVLRETFPGKF